MLLLEKIHLGSAQKPYKSPLCDRALQCELILQRFLGGLRVCLRRPRLALAACVQIQVAGNLKQASKARLYPQMWSNMGQPQLLMEMKENDPLTEKKKKKSHTKPHQIRFICNLILIKTGTFQARNN